MLCHRHHHQHLVLPSLTHELKQQPKQQQQQHRQEIHDDNDDDDRHYHGGTYFVLQRQTHSLSRHKDNKLLRITESTNNNSH